MRALAATWLIASLVVAAVVIVIAGCSSSTPSVSPAASVSPGSSASSASSSSSRPPATSSAVAIDQACIDLYVNTMNTLDVSDINPIDGLDAAERARLDSQLNAIEVQHPELGPDGRCHPLLDQSASLDDTTVQEIIGRLKPDVLAALAYRPH